MVYGLRRALLLSQPTQMMSGLAAHLIGDQLVAIMFSLVRTSLAGVLRNKALLLLPLQKLNIDLQLTQLQNLLGFARFSMIFTSLFLNCLGSSVITSQQSPRHLIVFFMLALSMLSLTTTTFQNWFWPIFLKYSLFAVLTNWLIFIPSLCLKPDSVTCVPSFQLDSALIHLLA